MKNTKEYTVYSNGISKFIFIGSHQMSANLNLSANARGQNKIDIVEVIKPAKRQAEHANGSLQYITGCGDSADLSGIPLKRGKTYGKFKVC